MSDRWGDALADVRGQVGVVRRTPIEPISELAARRFAVACGEHDPVFFDRTAAEAAGWRATPLPPLLLSSTRSWGPGPAGDELSLDGTPAGDVGFPAGHGLRAMGGGQRLAWHGDAVAGEPMHADAEVVGVDHKHGQSGDLLVVAIERRFYAADGSLLLECAENRVLR
jgi:hypothetical protein